MYRVAKAQVHNYSWWITFMGSFMIVGENFVSYVCHEISKIITSHGPFCSYKMDRVAIPQVHN